MRRSDLSRRVTEHAHFGSVKWCIQSLNGAGCSCMDSQRHYLERGMDGGREGGWQ